MAVGRDFACSQSGSEPRRAELNGRGECETRKGVEETHVGRIDNVSAISSHSPSLYKQARQKQSESYRLENLVQLVQYSSLESRLASASASACGRGCVKLTQ